MCDNGEVITITIITYIHYESINEFRCVKYIFSYLREQRGLTRIWHVWPILEHCLHMFCKNIWNLEQNKCKAKSNDKDHWRRVLFQITNGVRSLMFYWGSADHIQRDAEVRWCDMTWVVARPLTFDSLANLVTLAAFCWCRTPSPWWRVHFFFFFKYQQYFFNHPFMRMIIESHLSKLVRTPAPATPLTMFTPAPLGKRKYCQFTSSFF